MEHNLLPCVEIEPKHKATASIIWLHGLGADGHDFAPLVPQLMSADAAWRFIFPHAPKRPVTINGGYVMPAWYDIFGFDVKQKEDERGIRASSEQVQAFIDREITRGISPGKIILAGFSQGGAMALHCGLRYPQKLAGILALSTYVLLPEFFKNEVSKQSRETPIFMAHGTSDTLIPMMFAQGASQFLRNEGCSVDFRSYAMAHGVCEEEVRDVREWLTQTLA